jgi:hypothetical protein
MWKRLSDWIQRVSTDWVALLALVIFLLFTLLVLPGQSTKAETDSGDAGSPDTSFFYTAEDLYKMAQAYGEEGRQAYITARFTFDLIWPLVYTGFLGTGISWIFQKAFTPGSLWQRANLVPVLGALFDYLENVSTSVVMVRYPSRTALVDTLAAVFTMVKWVFVFGSFVLLLTGVTVGAVRWLRARSKQ